MRLATNNIDQRIHQPQYLNVNNWEDNPNSISTPINNNTKKNQTNKIIIQFSKQQ